MSSFSDHYYIQYGRAQNVICSGKYEIKQLVERNFTYQES